MVLGAGINQLPIIKKALALGHDVITVSYLIDDPGHKLAHSRALCSIKDKAGVLKAARAHKIDGIVNLATEIAVPTASYVAEKMGLPG